MNEYEEQNNNEVVNNEVVVEPVNIEALNNEVMSSEITNNEPVSSEVVVEPLPEAILNVPKEEIQTIPDTLDNMTLSNEEVPNNETTVNNVVAPFNENEMPEKKEEVKEEVKLKKKKSTFGKIINVIIWLVVLGWFCIFMYDFINTVSEKDPMFCLERSTENNSDGTVKICEGVGYKVFDYDYGSIKALEFAPFWNKPKTAEELNNRNKK